jgi:polyisoprenoid-binding protein YceI
METFEGKTSRIDGYIYWEADQITVKSAVYFEVDLNSIRTGIGLRDRHMRENYLETDRWPKAFFKGKITHTKDLGNGRKAVHVSGIFSVHGVENPLDLEGTMEFKGDQIIITASFDILLTDYNIKIPKIMFLKLDNEIRIRIRILLEKYKEEG